MSDPGHEEEYAGEGVRVSVDPVKMAAYPESEGWFLKKKAKKDQDVPRLEAEIEQLEIRLRRRH